MRSFRSHNDPTRLRGVESGYIFWPCSPELARAASNEVGDLAVSSAAPSIAMRVNCYCNETICPMLRAQIFSHWTKRNCTSFTAPQPAPLARLHG
jgi:hypothetical protein